MFDSPVYEAARLIEQRHADERNCRALALETALELAKISGGGTARELIADAALVLSFLQVPAPPGAEILASALEKEV